MATTTRPVATEQDLLDTPRDGQKYELVDGQIRVSPAGSRHGKVCVRLVVLLGGYVRERGLGQVFESSTGFRLPGGNVRVPDVSFVANGRFPGDEVPEGFPDLAPDLSVEVLSPDDRPRDILDKVGEYLQAGVHLVWVIDWKRRKALVYRSLTDVRTLGPEDLLEGEDVVPGFQCRLAEVID
jgi:Uma2 family endonuclease